eukprot:g44189.t1
MLGNIIGAASNEASSEAALRMLPSMVMKWLRNNKPAWRTNQPQVTAVCNILHSRSLMENGRTPTQRAFHVESPLLSSKTPCQRMSKWQMKESKWMGAELSMVAIMKEMGLVKLIGLKVDKSPGPDRLHPRVLKETAEETVE